MGAGGTGGKVGGGGDGGTAGAGATGGQGGGSSATGGAGGDPAGGAYGWVDDPEIWRELDIPDPVNSRILMGDPSQFDFPSLEWEECGLGCTSSKLGFGDVTARAVLESIPPTPQGKSEVHVAVSHVLLSKRAEIRRMIRLTDGVTTSALYFVENDPEISDLTVAIRDGGAGIFLIVGSQRGELWASYGPETGWDLKRPWSDDTRFATWCHAFGLAIEPPVNLFACADGLHMMKERGSTSTIRLPESEGSATGEGNHGVAVWAQHLFEEGRGRFSRVRAWSPNGEIRTIDEFPGDVCRLAVGKNHIAGFRGEETVGSGFCLGMVSSPRFFWIPAEGGQVKEGPVLPAEEMIVQSMSTTDEFTAAVTFLSIYRDIPHEERARVTLIRHEDGKMRQFAMPPTGYTMGWTTVALDDEYLYYTLWNARVGDHSFDRVYRYRLDHFDEIGLPYPPEGG